VYKDSTTGVSTCQKADTTSSLSFANHRDEGVSATAHVAIYDAENALVAELAPKTFSVGAGATGTTFLTANLDGIVGETCSAAATVMVDTQSYGPATAAFQFGHPVYLPLIFNQTDR
jgi:hypothetical protein